jgi:hypothetical protein
MPLPSPLAPALLHMSSATQALEGKAQGGKAKKKEKVQLATRSSPRFRNNLKKRKPIVQLAQEMLTKKWGILSEDKDLEEITLQHYVDLYRKPLSQSAMAAVIKLTEVAKMKKKNKKELGKKKKKVS